MADASAGSVTWWGSIRCCLAVRAVVAGAPGDREVFPWTPVLLALHTSMQGQDAHWLTIAGLMGVAVLMLLTRRGTPVRKLSALLLGRFGGVGDV